MSRLDDARHLLFLLTIKPHGLPAVSGWYTLPEVLAKLSAARASGIAFTHTLTEDAV